VFKSVNLYIYLDIVLSIIVQNIIKKKIVDKYIYLSIYIIDINKIIFKVRLYITKSIKTKIILDNNILEIF